MRFFAAFVASLALCSTVAACGATEAYPYPQSASAKFHRTCRSGDAICECMWDDITHHIPYEEYEAALDRFKEKGLMDHRIAHARTYCLEHHTGG